MKTRVTSGSGWSLSSDEPAPVKKQSSTAPKPHSIKTRSAVSPQPHLRLEKRNGKFVTVISGLHTYGAERLEKIARELKTTCGAGGTVKNGTIEIQGDKLTPIRNWFTKASAK